MAEHHAQAAKQDWQERHRQKVSTAEQAVSCVRHGDRVFVGSGAGEPQTLVEALSLRRDLSDTEIVHILTLGIAPYAEPRFGSRFRHNAFFIGPNVRQAVAQGRADYTPIFLSEIPELFRSGRTVIDVALIAVSPPDDHGYCSYGVSTDIVKAAAESAMVVVAEVNAQMPRVLGDCFIHVRDIDALVPTDRPILEAPQGEPDELARRIARHIANLVEDGATLQLGIGTALMNSLVDAARSRGIAGFTADVLLANHGMLRIFHKCGYAVESELRDGVYHLRIPFTAKRKSAAGATRRMAKADGSASSERSPAEA